MTLQIAAALVSSLGFAVLFGRPRQQLLAGGLVGALGWAVYLSTLAVVGPYGATLLSAMAVGWASQALGALYGGCADAFALPGIIPLVPGTNIYWAFLALVEGRLQAAAQLGGETFLYAAAISLGLALSSPWISSRPAE